MKVGAFLFPIMETNYLFQSERLGFRNWKDSDLDKFAKINADNEVMKHFPKPLSKEETKEFIVRLQKHFKERRYNYFATEILSTGEFIGFIGLAYQVYETDFTPAVDIGWRLKPSSWGKGYATEGAKRCLEYGFINLKLDRVISTCTIDNTSSELVMKKIGMTKKGTFNHPLLKEYKDYEKCIYYEIKSEDFSNRKH